MDSDILRAAFADKTTKPMGEVQHLKCEPFQVQSLDLKSGEWKSQTMNGYAVRIVNWNYAQSLKGCGACVVRLDDAHWLWWNAE